MDEVRRWNAGISKENGKQGRGNLVGRRLIPRFWPEAAAEKEDAVREDDRIQ